MDSVKQTKVWLQVKSTVNTLKETSFGKLYKKYSNEIKETGIKLIQCPHDEVKQWPEVTISDNLISELDDSGYR